MEPSKYCDSKNEEKLYSYRTEGFFNTKILPSATAQYHSTYRRTVIPDSTWDSIIFPIPAAYCILAYCILVSSGLWFLEYEYLSNDSTMCIVIQYWSTSTRWIEEHDMQTRDREITTTETGNQKLRLFCMTSNQNFVYEVNCNFLRLSINNHQL